MEKDRMKPNLAEETARWLLREMWRGCDGRWFLNVAQTYGYSKYLVQNFSQIS